MPSVPVLISDAFEGAFPSHVPWQDFTLRFAEADISSGAKNLTAELLTVAGDVARLGALQRSLQSHAADVLWEAPDSKVGSHALTLATDAVRNVCAPGAQSNSAAFSQPKDVPKKPGPQIYFAPSSESVA